MAEQDDSLDSAAKRILAVNRWSIAQLRRLSPGPYGFVPATLHPPPAFVRSRLQMRPLGVARAVLTRSPIPVGSVTLAYRAPSDLTDFIEVTTDFTRRRIWSFPLDDELGLAAERDAAIGPADAVLAMLEDDDIDSPFDHSTTPIVVDGQQRNVKTLTCGRYHAMRFERESLLVTVISRIPMPNRPEFEFERLTDLEHFLANSSDDLEIVKTWLRGHREDVQAWLRNPHTGLGIPTEHGLLRIEVIRAVAPAMPAPLPDARDLLLAFSVG